MKPPRIRVVTGKGLPSVLELGGLGDPLVLGRQTSSQMVLDGERVSREHARLVPEAGGWAIEDMRSSTGTMVNGSFVEHQKLAPGDRIQLGSIQLVYEEGEPVQTASGRIVVEADGAATDRLLAALAALMADETAAVPELLERMLDGLLEGFNADRAFVFVPGAGEAFAPACKRYRPGAAVGPEEPVSRSLVGRVARDQLPLLLSTLETLELRKEFESIPGTLCSIVAAPLTLPGGSGVLYLDSALEHRRFLDRDRDVLMAFARAAGDLLARGAERRREKRKSERFAEILKRGVGGDEILGRSPVMRSVLEEVTRAARAEVTVLVTGESGTGKELVARSLHRSSPRAEGPFVAVNCAAIPPELVESELFGHEKGAFTGAADRRLGQFELAEGGTLFLDEVGELPLAAQGKLLRALQDKAIQRVGAARPVAVDFRLVAATNVALEEAVKKAAFREDLYYRLAVFRIQLPPLRARGDDVLLLAETFLAKFSRELKRPVHGFAPEALEALRRHPWPGNIRELRNVIEQAVVREDGAAISLAALAPAMGRGPMGSPAAAGAGGFSVEAFPPNLDEARRIFERRFLEHHLERMEGNMKATAEALGLSRRNLYAKCDELGIDYSGFRGA